MVDQQPPARLLDLSRIVSRAGRVPTGIDRVEYAYLREFATGSVEVYALVRTALGYLLLDRQGMQRFLDFESQQAWPKPDLMSRLNRRLSDAAKSGQSAARGLAIDRTLPSGLQRMLQRRMPKGFQYFNVGHSNLTERVLGAVAKVEHSEITVMIHDAIPLDFPQLQKAGSTDRFAGIMDRVSRHADRVICISQAESERIAYHFSRLGRTPDITVAHLGLDVVKVGELPDQLHGKPFFMTVGTIEPRKNHALLLDVWDQLGPDAPALVICGSRGWNNEATFARLDQGVPGVIEMSDLSDAAIRAMYEQSLGFLFPTFAEGFGLPPVEAAIAGAPVLCANLPSCREILGDKAVYLDQNDSYQWEKEVKQLIGAERQREEQPFVGPTWEAHFKTVFTIK